MSEQKIVVNEEELTNPPVSEDDKTQNQTQEVKEEAPVTVPGDKTDPNLLLQSLHEEREKRRVAEERVRILESSSTDSDDEVFSDEGKALKREIDTLKAQMRSKEEREALDAVYAEYPVLKDKKSEFDEYRSQYPLVDIRGIAKLFLAENGMFEPKRKGLERPTGGDKTPTSSGMTAKDAENLRKNSPKKYREMIKKGQLVISG